MQSKQRFLLYSIYDNAQLTYALQDMKKSLRNPCIDMNHIIILCVIFK